MGVTTGLSSCSVLSLRVGYRTFNQHHGYRKIHKMSLWKVMTMPMSQVARQASTHESAQVGKFVWGKEGFKWTAGVSDTSGIKMTSPGAQQSFSSSINITNHGSCTQLSITDNSCDIGRKKILKIQSCPK